MATDKKPIIFCLGTTVKVNKTASKTWKEDVGKDFLVNGVTITCGKPEYSLSQLGAWFRHKNLDFVKAPTKKALVELARRQEDGEED